MAMGHLQATSGGEVVATATTDASGAADLQLPTLAGGSSLVVSYAASAAAIGSSQTLTVPTVRTLSLNGPASVPAGHSITLTAGVSPPIAGLSVSLTGGALSLAAITDALGHATFTFVPPIGITSFTAGAKDQWSNMNANLTVTVAPWATSLSASMPNPTEVDVQLSVPGDSPHGDVVDVFDKSGAWLNSRTVNDDGSAVIPVGTKLQTGDQLTVSFRGSATQRASSTVVTVPVWPTVTLSGPTSLLRGATGKFTVRVSPPQPGLDVSLNVSGIYWPIPHAVTDASGVARFTETSPGAFGTASMVASVDSFVGVLSSDPLTITLADPVILSRSAPALGQFAAVLTSQSARPLGGVVVTLADNGAVIASSTTDLSGTARFSVAVPAGDLVKFSVASTPTTFAASVNMTVPAFSQIGRSEALVAGELLRSPNGRLVATFDSTGRLSILQGSKVIWSSRAQGLQSLELLPNGNLVLRDGEGTKRWSAKSARSGADALRLTNGGKLVLAAAGRTLWSTSSPGGP